MRLPHRELGRIDIAVDSAAARREHHLAAAGRLCPFQHIDAAEQVDLGVVAGTLDRHPHVHLGGEVENNFGLAPGDEVDHVAGADVDLVEREVVVLTGSGVGQVGERPRRQVVGHIDGVALGQQPVNERRTDEACSAGDENPHAHPFSFSSTAGCPVRKLSSTSPGSMVAPPPTTQRLVRWASAPTTAASPTMELSIMAPGPMTDPGSTTDRRTMAPGPIRAPAPMTEWPTWAPPSMVAPRPMNDVGCTSPSATPSPSRHTPGRTSTAPGAGGQ